MVLAPVRKATDARGSAPDGDHSAQAEIWPQTINGLQHTACIPQSNDGRATGLLAEGDKNLA
jgi:hypothetical protein